MTPAPNLRSWPMSVKNSTAYVSAAADPLHETSELPLAYKLFPQSRKRYGRLGFCFRVPMLRKILCLVAFIFILFSFTILSSGIPPLFNDIRKYERSLIQHNITEALAEGRRYLHIPDRVTGHGLNNVLQQTLILSYLAYRTQRSYVFEDYIWSSSISPYVIHDLTLRPSRVPLNAFISGPTAGGPMQHPRAVSAEFWESICPPESRHIVSSAGQPTDAEGDALLDWWIKRIDKSQQQCVEIDSHGQLIFDHSLFGGTQVLSLWEGFVNSPILQEYAWSPLVNSAIHKNLAIIESTFLNSPQSITLNTPFQGLVAIHLRRGDFKRHCYRMVGWNANYMGFNRFPQFLDKFEVPPESDHNARTQYYLRHCLPTIEQIVERLRTVRKDHPGLRKVYALTNGWGWWLNNLKAALLKDGWDDMKSTLDLRLDSEQKHVNMAIDMAIAEKAEVFIGNGFSSLTSNIMMLRMANSLNYSTNRLL